jgi:receptor-interacting serine/threonine-protein kinase 4
MDGQTAVAQLLLSAQAAVGAAATVDGRTALHCAAGMGHPEVVQQLLNAQAAVNTVSSDGFTALHAAAHKDHPAVVRLLLDAHADVLRLMMAPQHCTGRQVWVTLQ